MATFTEARDAREKWIHWLIDGDLQQAKGKLAKHDYSAFCCLGVAEEYIGPEIGVTRDGNGIYALMTGEAKLLKDTASGIMHGDLRRYLGLTPSQSDILANLNDNGTNFKIIAEVIRLMEYHCDDGVFSNYGIRLGYPVKEL